MMVSLSGKTFTSLILPVILSTDGFHWINKFLVDDLASSIKGGDLFFKQF